MTLDRNKCKGERNGRRLKWKNSSRKEVKKIANSILKKSRNVRKIGRKEGQEKENEASATDQKPQPGVRVEFESRSRSRQSKIVKAEKKGIQGLNQAFVQLKNLVPRLPSDKLSKIQTVRLATFYIDFLFKLSANISSQTGPNFNC